MPQKTPAKQENVEIKKAGRKTNFGFPRFPDFHILVEGIRWGSRTGKAYR